MEVINPYLETKRALLLALDKARDKTEHDILMNKYEDNEQKLREYNTRVLARLSENLEAIKETEIRIPAINLHSQYRQAISYYKQTRDLLLEIRQIKKELREAIELQRQKNQIQKDLETWVNKK